MVGATIGRPYSTTILYKAMTIRTGNARPYK